MNYDDRQDGQKDLNRDPITQEPGSHPVGTGVGAVSGAAGGALIGGLFGPIGMLIGGGIGAVAGGGAGHAVGEMVNPTAEADYWREQYTLADYHNADRDFDRDMHPAYKLGWESRSKHGDRDWDDVLAAELSEEWNEFKTDSNLEWDEARHAVQDAWKRTDKTFKTYNKVDNYYKERYTRSDYYDQDYGFEDYTPAYRYGAYSKYRDNDLEWDDRLENKMEREWDEFKGESRLTWHKAKDAVKDAWHSVEKILPGDFDNDGR